MITIPFNENWHDIGVELALGFFLLMVVGILLTILMFGQGRRCVT